MTDDLIIIITACLVAVAGSCLGVFLVLRRQSMLSDAIGHAALPGIVAAYWFSGGTATIPALIGASAMGLLTIVSTELLERTRLLKVDAAIGSIFPLFFSIGILLVSLFFRNAHLDTDAVLYGEIAYAPLNVITLGSHEVPESLLIMGILAFINIAFVSLFYKELKVSTFDKGLAASLGFYPTALHYALMILLSMTVVGAFQSVGAILISAFIIIPATCSYLLTHKLRYMLIISATIGISCSIVGYYLALKLDTSIAGMIATCLGLILILCFLFAPRRGLLANFLRKRNQRTEFSARLLIHTLGHDTLNKDELAKRLHWHSGQLEQALRTAHQRQWISQNSTGYTVNHSAINNTSNPYGENS